MKMLRKCDDAENLEEKWAMHVKMNTCARSRKPENQLSMA